MKVIHAIIGIVAIVVVAVLIFLSVEGRMNQGAQCYFVGNCEYDDNHVGFHYYQCFGSYASYSNWWQDSRCQYPNETPTTVWKRLGY